MLLMAETLKIDAVGFSQSKTSLVYPYLEIKEINEVTPSVIDSLEKGDEVMLIGSLDGKRKVIGHITMSAYNVERLLRVHQGGLVYVESEECKHEILVIEDYVGVFRWT